MQKTEGSVMDFLTVGVTLLAMGILVLAVFCSAGLMLKKLEVSQVARKYILAMETQGGLTENVKAELLAELEALGLKEIDITGTTAQPVKYGETIKLCIKGKITGNALNTEGDIWSNGFNMRDYQVEEIRMSTAKN